jgi:hypothetical protein
MKLRLNSGADIQKTTLALKHFTKFLTLFAILAACAGEENVMRDADMRYFPLQTGLFHIYAIQETRYTAATKPLVLNYEVMTEVVDSFPSQNQYTYVIRRSRRAGETDAWEPLDTWSARMDKHAVIVAEGNISFVKVKFPVSPENRWDGNALNTMAHDEYAFADIHQLMHVDGMTFEKTVTVEEERNEDVIVFRDERRDVYALDVGLVYREVIQLNYCTDDNCLGQQIIEDGVELKMAIKEYGKH